MKFLILSATIFFAGASDLTMAASYDDNNLDDEAYECMAGIRDSGEYPRMPCQFAGDEVILSLPDGRTVRATMPSKELPTDGSAVIAMDKDGKAWQFTFIVPAEWSEDS
jgi:hypothetical protein